MKKIYIFLILVFGLLFTGCGKPTFNDYIEKVDLPEVIEGELFLPAQVNDDGNHDIYWTSSDTATIKISSSNVVTRDGLLYYTTQINKSEIDVPVTLTMRLVVLNLGEKIVEYNVVVKKDDSISESDVIDFTFYGINDFHGAVYSDDGGLSILGNYLITEREKHPSTTVMIASGDMFQGSAISNMTMGGVVVEAMNEIGFDAMCMGNHEFDWGIDIIRDYNNKTSKVKSNFPIICCNIYERSTNKAVDWCEPYTIIERSGIKIGIIGAMGSELESSIAQNRIEPYEFVDPIPLIKQYTKYLRENQDCELVVLTIHDATDKNAINTILADLTGVYQLDAVFNGHTHKTYAGETMGSDNVRMPYLQSGCYGSAIGKIVLSYNKVTKKLVDSSAMNITMSPRLCEPNEKLDQIIKKFDKEVAPIANEVLGVSGAVIDQTTCARWAVNVIRDLSGCQVGFINNGGIRNGAFPIKKNEEVKVSRVWEIMPFDNQVKTCTMTAFDIKKLFSGDILHSSNCSINSNNKLVVDGKVYEDNDTISVAAVDYIFDKPNLPFMNGTNQINTGELFRNYLIDAIREECKGGKLWQCVR